MRHWHRGSRVTLKSSPGGCKRALLKQGATVDIYVAGLAALTPEHDDFTRDLIKRGLAEESERYAELRAETELD